MTVDGMQEKKENHLTTIDQRHYIFIETTASSTKMPTQLIFYIQIVWCRITKGRTGNSIQDAVFFEPADGTTETLPLGDEKVYGFI
jgi:hypothetical protein